MLLVNMSLIYLMHVPGVTVSNSSVKKISEGKISSAKNAEKKKLQYIFNVCVQ